MQPMKLFCLTVWIVINVCEGNAQETVKMKPVDVYTRYEQRLNDFFQRTGLQRIEVEGFLFYSNTDSIPQDIFVVQFPLAEYNNDKTLEENFFELISKPGATAIEEVFSPLQSIMPTLQQELNQGDKLIVNSDYPPVFNGLPLRVIYGRLIYRSHFPDENPVFPPPSVPVVTIYHQQNGYPIKILTSTIGNPKLFRTLK